MRMRKKKWAVPELEASPLYIKAPASLKSSGSRRLYGLSRCIWSWAAERGGFASQFALANRKKICWR